MEMILKVPQSANLRLFPTPALIPIQPPIYLDIISYSGIGSSFYERMLGHVTNCVEAIVLGRSE